VAFAVLHPPAGFGARGNDSSCVLRIETASFAALLTGDIEARGERALLPLPQVRADVVVVPHHGSATSSTEAFVAATRARWALVSAGHANRWGFPKPEARKRWEAHGATMIVTGDAGAITVDLTSSGVHVETERGRRRRYWDAQAAPAAMATAPRT
jgi:competence protein ComEC